MRPRSIVIFEWIYPLGIVIGLLSMIAGYIAMRRITLGDPFAVMNGVMVAMIYGVPLVSMVVKLVLWFFAARHASNVARWIIVVFLGLSVVGVIRLLILMSGTPGVMFALAEPLVVVGIQLICVILLFQPDASAWFRARNRGDWGDAPR